MVLNELSTDAPWSAYSTLRFVGTFILPLLFLVPLFIADGFMPIFMSIKLVIKIVIISPAILF